MLRVPHNPLFRQSDSATKRFSLVTVTGVSNTVYEFQVYPVGAEFLKFGGVYIFTKLAANGQWDALYVGEAEDIESRCFTGLTAHHQFAAARKLGMTHIGVMGVIGGKQERCRIETDIRHALNPPCNEQSVPINPLERYR